MGNTTTAKHSSKNRSELEKFKLFYEFDTTNQEARKKIKQRISS